MTDLVANKRSHCVEYLVSSAIALSKCRVRKAGNLKRLEPVAVQRLRVTPQVTAFYYG